jgi:Putative quorum-sensing-regulated virulence factor
MAKFSLPSRTEVQGPYDPHHVICPIGKYKGELVTRLPQGYLKWAVNEEVDAWTEVKGGFAKFHKVAKAELERRGTRTDGVEISGHAVDRFSQRFINHWEKNGGGKGIFSYIEAKALEAWNARNDPLVAGEIVDDGTWEIAYEAIVWCFQELVIPVLKTVK